jgi:hypothetical protein
MGGHQLPRIACLETNLLYLIEVEPANPRNISISYMESVLKLSWSLFSYSGSIESNISVNIFLVIGSSVDERPLLFLYLRMNKIYKTLLFDSLMVPAALLSGWLR